MAPNHPIPPAPWVLTGRASLFLASPLCARLLVNYTSTPVGPYVEHALVQLTGRGPMVTQMGVTSEATRIAGRANWGFPKVLEELTWEERGPNVHFRRGRRSFHLRAVGPTMGISVPFFSVQELNGRLVRVPGHLQGRLQLAWSGKQLAILVNSFVMRIDPALPLE